jgi:XisI protein
MEQLEQYRQWVQQVLAEHNRLKSSYGEVEQFMIVDTQNDHYQITRLIKSPILSVSNQLTQPPQNLKHLS